MSVHTVCLLYERWPNSFDCTSEPKSKSRCVKASRKENERAETTAEINNLRREKGLALKKRTAVTANWSDSLVTAL